MGRPSKRTSARIGSASGGIAAAIVSVFFIVYGLLAFMNPDKFTILSKLFEYQIIEKIDPYLGLVFAILGFLILFKG
ncbi:MAG: hypothetical protein HPY60_08280 [Candidatus Methanofastidiosum sp.]|nr:hypothetical protein [Candidatus Methanofastidiosa archaeon]NPV51172.1 hypothetical protein [Methanofastidiosum sp.]